MENYKTWVFMLLFFSSCGDLFSYEEKIFKQYYLVNSDVKQNISLVYKTAEGDMIGRVPAKVTGYAVLGDSLLVVESKGLQGSSLFYIININGDNDFAEERSFLKAKYNKAQYDNWKHGRDIILVPVEIK